MRGFWLSSEGNVDNFLIYNIMPPQFMMPVRGVSRPCAQIQMIGLTSSTKRPHPTTRGVKRLPCGCGN